ncbi:MAG: carbohydrate kinase family protein [Nitrosomonadaceae bacterium]|nr:carbohydrate kinase family protein [Nitrosomonadaceae bacterium]
MRTLICGSIAYDTIMTFHDHFNNHILPEKINILNVAFLTPEMRREFGGCDGNIAYNLQMIGGSPLIMATVGDDYQPYAERMKKLGLVETHIKHVKDTFTAQAFITTDLADNQITSFHPGAMNFSHYNHITNAKNIKLGIVSPDGRNGMLQHAQEFYEAGIPFLFDPGQGLPMFSGAELHDFIRKANYVTVNDYESQLLQERTECTLQELAKLVKGLIVTKGAQGSIIFTNNKEIKIPCVKADKEIDPTGCGDAYRAGLLYGIANGMDWQTTGQLGSLMGALKISQRGGQNHNFSYEEISHRYFEFFGSHIT